MLKIWKFIVSVLKRLSILVNVVLEILYIVLGYLFGDFNN